MSSTKNNTRNRRTAKNRGKHSAVASQPRVTPVRTVRPKKQKKKGKTTPNAKNANKPSALPHGKGNTGGAHVGEKPRGAPSKKPRVGGKPDPVAQHTAENPFERSVEKFIKIRQTGGGVTPTHQSAANAGPATGETTDPSKKVGRVANTSAQKGLGNTICPSKTVGPIAHAMHGAPFPPSSSAFDKCVKKFTAKQKKNQCQKKFARPNHGR